MFCKVCKDSNKSKKQYMSHQVKTYDGKVICRTLLNQLCRYCHMKGHTVKFCLVLNNKKRREAKIQSDNLMRIWTQNHNTSTFDIESKKENTVDKKGIEEFVTKLKEEGNVKGTFWGDSDSESD